MFDWFTRPGDIEVETVTRLEQGGDAEPVDTGETGKTGETDVIAELKAKIAELESKLTGPGETASLEPVSTVKFDDVPTAPVVTSTASELDQFMNDYLMNPRTASKFLMQNLDKIGPQLAKVGS